MTYIATEYDKARLKLSADELFIIPNLSFLNYIGHKLTEGQYKSS